MRVPTYAEYGSGRAGYPNVAAVAVGLCAALAGTRKVVIRFTEKPPRRFNLVRGWHSEKKATLTDEMLEYCPVLPHTITHWHLLRHRDVEITLEHGFSETDILEFADALGRSVEMVRVLLPFEQWERLSFSGPAAPTT